MTPKQKIQKTLVNVSEIYNCKDLQELSMDWAANNGHGGAEIDTVTGDVYLSTTERYATMDELLDIIECGAAWCRDREDLEQCKCGEITGVACEGFSPANDLVTIEYMPEYLRESHAAAGNSGVYPHNGAIRLSVSPYCAAALVGEEGEWINIVE